MNEIWSNVNVVALNYSKFVLCCIEFVLIVVCKKYVTLFWMCTHRFSNPRHESVCLELCANGFVDASHIAKLFKISFATNMCRVYLCPRIMFFANPKKIFFHLAASVWDRRNLRCNNLFLVPYFYEYINKSNFKQ